jgi:predicted Rossmann-fold nucleotide-binding protein
MIGVCGSSKELSSEAATFCGALGRRLAQDPLARIVSGGTRRRAGRPSDDLAADWLIVNAACETIGPDHELERVVTVLREGDPHDETEAFRKGTERRARGKTGEARRISFVRGLDALIAVGGRGGTAQELALAIEQHIRVLPVPTFDGRAREFWDAYRSDLLTELRIDEERAARWESPPELTPRTLQELADEMVDMLFRSLPRRCFVIMPFHRDFDGLYDFVIAAAVRAAGDEPLRVDRVGAPGDAIRMVQDGIRNCEYSIAVLDGMRPNVLYELGLAHGQSKPTILMNREGTLGADGEAPFDLYTHQRLQYSKIDQQLTTLLAEMVKGLTIGRV